MAKKVGGVTWMASFFFTQIWSKNTIIVMSGFNGLVLHLGVTVEIRKMGIKKALIIKALFKEWWV